jgi:hypothetical protein
MICRNKIYLIARSVNDAGVRLVEPKFQDLTLKLLSHSEHGKSNNLGICIYLRPSSNDAVPFFEIF